MADSGRTVFGSVGGNSDGLVFDNAAGSAVLASIDGTLSLAGEAGGFTDTGDWPDPETNLDISGTDATFGAWDDFNDGGSYEFVLSEAGLYYLNCLVNFTGPGSGLDRRARFRVSSSEFSPWAFEGYSGTRLAIPLPAAEGRGLRLEFASGDVGDSVAAFTFTIRRLLAGAWE